MKILRTIVVDTKEPEHKEVVWIDTKERVVAKIYNNEKWQTVEYAEFLNFITLDQLIVVLKDYISKEELLDLLLNKIGKEHLTKELKNEIEGKQEKLIAGDNINIDELTNTISAIYEEIPDATEELKGKAKLYKELGDNIDGAVDQKTVSSYINTIIDKVSTPPTYIKPTTKTSIIYNGKTYNSNVLIEQQEGDVTFDVVQNIAQNDAGELIRMSIYGKYNDSTFKSEISSTDITKTSLTFTKVTNKFATPYSPYTYYSSYYFKDGIIKQNNFGLNDTRGQIKSATIDSSYIQITSVFPILANYNNANTIEKLPLQDKLTDVIVTFPATNTSTLAQTLKIQDLHGNFNKTYLLNTVSGKYEEIDWTNYFDDTTENNTLRVLTSKEKTIGQRTFKFTFK